MLIGGFWPEADLLIHCDFLLFAVSLRISMLLDLFVTIGGPIAEKRYLAVRRAFRWSGAVFLGTLALYAAYSLFAS